MSLQIGFDVANTLRLAGEGARGVQQRVVIELDEGLERDVEASAVIEDGAMMIGNPPRPRIEIKASLEFAGLREAADSVKVSPPRSVQLRPPGRRLNSRI